MQETLEAYELLKQEVQEFNNEILSVLKDKPTAEKMYKGCVLLYSALLKNPPFLFLGINPGAGYYNSTGIKITDLQPGENFEYLEAKDNYDFQLAADTRDIFEKAGFYDALKNSVKSNYYYVATSNEKELYALFDELGDNLRARFHQKAQKWNRDLIALTNPKVVICEGKRVFDLVNTLFGTEAIWENEVGHFYTLDNALVVGYKRMYSNIRNKDQVATFLKKHVNIN